MNLRERARMQECQIRLPGVCNFNPETTVLCHLRMAGITGIGMKASDVLGAHGCSACHDEVDRRTRHLPDGVVRVAFLEAILRTLDLWISCGVINVQGVRGSRK